MRRVVQVPGCWMNRATTRLDRAKVSFIVAKKGTILLTVPLDQINHELDYKEFEEFETDQPQEKGKTTISFVRDRINLVDFPGDLDWEISKDCPQTIPSFEFKPTLIADGEVTDFQEYKLDQGLGNVGLRGWNPPQAQGKRAISFVQEFVDLVSRRRSGNP